MRLTVPSKRATTRWANSQQHRPLLAACLLTALLSACTGTTEDAVVLRLAVLSGVGDGAVLSAVDVGSPASLVTPVPKALDLESLSGGTALAVLYPDKLETRDATFGKPETRANPADPGFKPCYVNLEASALRDRLAALSDCGGGALQQVAVWRSDGSLAFSATLPGPTPTSPEQTHIAVLGDTLWAVHPAVGGGSELIRVIRSSDGSAGVSTPTLTPTINDLTFYRGTGYAATDSGLRTLSEAGVLTAVPDTSKPPGGALTRLYADDRLLGAWAGGSYSALNIWNGAKTSSPTSFSDLRDLVFAPDGTLYTLSGNVLSQYDSAFGLADSGWRGKDLSSFTDPRAVTWLVPPMATPK
ncbi:hypothetical protein [Deinococcus sp.]|uniref:hypothetical protein n=1 Tax=Deinococcus sp. TaxID=47478 RepID=UPI0025E6B4C2|nr:hypothetical protein [Deinococcus sp.]